MPRVSHEKWMSMTPAQRSKLSKSLKGKGAKSSYRRTKPSGDRPLTSGYGRSITSIPLATMPIFAAKTCRRLRYNSNATLTSTAGAVTTYVIRSNDLFDPDFTSGGHQPMGFDQMMLFYNHFCVIKANIRVIFRNTSATKCTICIRQDANFTPITAIDRIVEMGGNVIDWLEPSGVQGDQKELSLSMDIARIQGVSNSAITADPTLRGDTANSPSEVTYFHFQVWDAFAATSVVNCDFILEQVSWFLEPRTEIQS